MYLPNLKKSPVHGLSLKLHTKGTWNLEGLPYSDGFLTSNLAV